MIEESDFFNERDSEKATDKQKKKKIFGLEY
jgi:hypothetical protein